MMIIIDVNMYLEKWRRVPLTIAKGWTIWPWRNVNLLSAKMSIANISSLQLKAGKGLANVPIFRCDGWPSLAEWGLCTPGN